MASAACPGKSCQHGGLTHHTGASNRGISGMVAGGRFGLFMTAEPRVLHAAGVWASIPPAYAGWRCLAQIRYEDFPHERRTENTGPLPPPAREVDGQTNPPRDWPSRARLARGHCGRGDQPRAVQSPGARGHLACLHSSAVRLKARVSPAGRSQYLKSTRQICPVHRHRAMRRTPIKRTGADFCLMAARQGRHHGALTASVKARHADPMDFFILAGDLSSDEREIFAAVCSGRTCRIYGKEFAAARGNGRIAPCKYERANRSRRSKR